MPIVAHACATRRGRVTALDAVEGLNVDANEVLNDRAVSVMRRMVGSHGGERSFERVF